MNYSLETTIINKKICNAVEDILKYHKDVMVPIRELLFILKREYKFDTISYDGLVHLLNNDDRFDYINIPEQFYFDDDIPKEISEEKHKVEELGFFSGSRVKLRRANLDLEKIIEILNRKVDLMMDVLVSIWNRRPEYDSDLEDHLIGILAKAQKMQREIKRVINSDKFKSLTDFVKRMN